MPVRAREMGKIKNTLEGAFFLNTFGLNTLLFSIFDNMKLLLRTCIHMRNDKIKMNMVNFCVNVVKVSNA